MDYQDKINLGFVKILEDFHTVDGIVLIWMTIMSVHVVILSLVVAYLIRKINRSTQKKI